MVEIYWNVAAKGYDNLTSEGRATWFIITLTLNTCHGTVQRVPNGKRNKNNKNLSMSNNNHPSATANNAGHLVKTGVGGCLIVRYIFIVFI